MVIQNQHSRPILENQCLLVVSEPEISFEVAKLFYLGCPAAIRGLLFCLAFLALAAGVIPKSVNAVYGMTGGRCVSHVRVECGERLPPTMADVMTGPAIETVVRILRPIAAVENSAPNFPFAFAGEAVPDHRFASALVKSDSSFKVVCADDSLSSANAFAEPEQFLTAVFGKRQDGDGTVLYSRQILRRPAACRRLAFSHDVALPKSVTLWLEPADVSASVPARFILRSAR